jgi:radical SAM protein with 4Fe4S-binding SPASM domain
MCVFEETCGLGLALELNGDLYSCDHFVEPEYLLGTVVLIRTVLGYFLSKEVSEYKLN